MCRVSQPYIPTAGELRYVRALHADAGRPVGRRAPDEIAHGAGVEQLDAHYGAWLSDYAGLDDLGEPGGE